MLLACDGVYDVMDNQEIVDLLSYKLGYTGTDTKKILKEGREEERGKKEC